MRQQDRAAFRAVVLGIGILFSWSGIVSSADAQVSTEERTVESTDKHAHGAASMGKRPGQSPSNKPSSKKEARSGSAGKRHGQSPTNKHMSKDAPAVDARQGQSPGE